MGVTKRATTEDTQPIGEDWWTKYRIYGPVIGIVLVPLFLIFVAIVIKPSGVFLNRGLMFLLGIIAFGCFEQHAYVGDKEKLRKQYKTVLTFTSWTGRGSLALLILGLIYLW